MEDLKIVGMVIAVVLASFAAFLGLVWTAAGYECSTYQSVTGHKTQMRALTCYINDGGQWYAWEEYKLRGATRGR